MLFTVISPSEDLIPTIKELLPKIKYKHYMIIEHGKDGDHEHYNLIFYETNKRTDVMTRYIRKLLPPGNYSKFLIVTKNLVALSGILYYLTKEEGYAIVGDMPASHKEILEKCRKDIRIKPIDSWVYCPTGYEFPFYTIEFIKTYVLQDNLVIDISDVLELMIYKRINVIPHLRRIRDYVFAINALKPGFLIKNEKNNF